MQNRDLQFLSGEFLEASLPKDQMWMKNQFSTVSQMQFLRYYTTFGDIEMFKEHTGISIDQKYLRRMKKAYHALLEMRDTAKKNFDIEKLWQIESGRIKKTQ